MNKNAPAAVNHITTNKTVINDGKASSSDKKDENKSLGVKIDCKTISLEEKFTCKSIELWDCFSKIELMTAFTRGDVKLDFNKNGE